MSNIEISIGDTAVSAKANSSQPAPELVSISGVVGCDVRRCNTKEERYNFSVAVHPKAGETVWYACFGRASVGGIGLIRKRDRVTIEGYVQMQDGKDPILNIHSIPEHVKPRFTGSTPNPAFKQEVPAPAPEASAAEESPF